MLFGGCVGEWKVGVVGVGGSFSYAFGPVVALLVVGVLVLVLRWAFGSSRVSVVAAAPRVGSADEYGLLVPVAAPGSFVAAEIARARLEDSGVRANVAATLDGPRVLVWPRDEQRARELLGV